MSDMLKKIAAMQETAKNLATRLKKVRHPGESDIDALNRVFDSYEKTGEFAPSPKPVDSTQLPDDPPPPPPVPSEPEPAPTPAPKTEPEQPQYRFKDWVGIEQALTAAYKGPAWQKYRPFFELRTVAGKTPPDVAAQTKMHEAYIMTTETPHFETLIYNAKHITFFGAMVEPVPVTG